MRSYDRRVMLYPYRRGMGPIFSLETRDTGKVGEYGKSQIAYVFKMHENGKTTVIFDACDFWCASHIPTDSDNCLESLLSFLTLRPGDTDQDYFNDYNELQLDYCSNHAEALQYYVYSRFGEG